jgi:hypothetical protein
MKSLTRCFAVPLTMLAISASAQGSPAQMAEQRFKAADKDGDGKLTREEARAGMPRVHSNFDKLDTGKLGFVTLDQVKAALSAAGQ